MNVIELSVYNLVKRHPRLKAKVRKAYQMVCSLVPIERNSTLYEIESHPGYFFGYYDKSPWSPSNDHIMLAHRFSIPVRMPGEFDEVDIGYFHNGRFKKMGTSTAWNWQQGAMLQWLGTDHHIIYNIFESFKHCAQIVDLQGRKIATLPRPVAAVSPDGGKALSYSFIRLRRCAPGYAYNNGEDPWAGHAAPASDGIYAVEILSETTRLICSLKDIAHYQPDDTMQGAYHYFNHCSFSPSGDRIVFLHRWQKNGREWTRMFTCGWNGEDFFVFPTSEMVSHFTWKDDQNILAWARVMGIGDRYFLFRDRSSEFVTIGDECFNSDGHPTYSRDGRWILTDTYPDKFRIAHLILYDTVEKKPYALAKLHAPFKYDGDVRCDLHPRWNRDDSMISFDSTHIGIRSLCTIKLDSLPPKDEQISAWENKRKDHKAD